MKKLSIKSITYLFLCWLFAVACRQETPPPDILIFLADDLGSTDLHCYGGPARTPNLDQLARNGLQFTDFYAPAPNCSPSRAGLMTGRTPSRTGMYNYRPDNHVFHLSASETTIAELLKTKDYQTVHIGKWHLGCLPQDTKLNHPQPADHGFDYSLGTENNAEPSHLNPRNFIRNGVPVGETDGYSCQLLADEAQRWFEQYRDPEKPFFLYVAFHETHDRIASPPALMERYEGPEAEYLANVENMDLAAGRIIDLVKQRGNWDNTIVVFASDNGPYRALSRGRLRGLKADVYEGGIRSPGILHWPARIKKGRLETTPAGLVDILPTLCEINQIDLPEKKIDGASLLPLLEGKPLQRTTPLFWYYYRTVPEVAMRMGDYVLLGNSLDTVPRTHPTADIDMPFIQNMQLKEFELYNVEQDSAQQVDLAADQSGRVEAMRPVMEQMLREVQAEGPFWEGMPAYDRERARLKIGYRRN
jgi:arylsulfatase A